MTDGPVSKGNGNGYGATTVWQFAMRLADKHGITALIAVALLALLIWQAVVREKSTGTAHESIQATVTQTHEHVKAMNSVMSRMVVLLESIDRQLCIQNAGDDRSRQRECVAPR
jgi:hypothetical protein